MKISGIYAIRHIDTGKVYIGSAIDVANRWRTHRSALNRGTHHAQKLQRAWAKYGAEAFVFETIEQVEPGLLIEAEQRWIDRYAAAGPQNYNSRKNASSNLGVKYSAEVRRHLSEMRRGERHPLFGTKRSPETLARMSEGRKGIKHTDEARAKMRGRKWSAADKARMSAQRRGIPKSPETIAKQVAARAANRARKKELL